MSPSTSGRPRSSSTSVRARPRATCSRPASPVAAVPTACPRSLRPRGDRGADRLVVLDDEDAGHAGSLVTRAGARPALWDDGVVTGRRAALAWGTAWLVVVIVATVLVWSVISRAGTRRRVGYRARCHLGDVGHLRRAGGSVGLVGAVHSSSTPRTSSTPAPSSPTASPGGDDSPTPANDPEPQRRTWEGAAGRVDVVCTASAAGLAGVVALDRLPRRGRRSRTGPGRGGVRGQRLRPPRSHPRDLRRRRPRLRGRRLSLHR